MNVVNSNGGVGACCFEMNVDSLGWVLCVRAIPRDRQAWQREHVFLFQIYVHGVFMTSELSQQNQKKAEANKKYHECCFSFFALYPSRSVCIDTLFVLISAPLTAKM